MEAGAYIVRRDHMELTGLCHIHVGAQHFTLRLILYDKVINVIPQTFHLFGVIAVDKERVGVNHWVG